MKNLKIGKKLLITFGIIIFLFLCTVVTALLGLTITGKNFKVFYNNGYKVTNNAMDMSRAIQAAGKYVGYSTMAVDKATTQKYLDACQAELDYLSEGATIMSTSFTGDKALVEKFTNTMKSGVETKNKVFEYAIALDNAKAAELYFNEYMPILLEANTYLDEMNTVAGADADDNFAESNQIESACFYILVALSIVALIITIVLSLYITRSLTRPISEIEAAANKIVSGDLNTSIEYVSKDELGSLSESMRRLCAMFRGMIADLGGGLSAIGHGDFTVDTSARELYIGDFESLLHSMYEIMERLSDTLAQINRAADQVSSGSEQVSSGSQALSQGATEQASSIEELSATINDISNQIQTTAQGAQDANQKVDYVADEINASNAQMQQLIGAMGDISLKSNEIGKIIKTIEDIAFQTNILALNAAVEAARAGAAGKGFAVVADEVRNLASKSAEAAKNTTALIEGSISAVENGTRLADETAQSLTRVVNGAGEVVTIVGKIAQAANEQAGSIAQVTTGVDQISSVIQTNSATAEESAAASEELTGQSGMLKELVGKFKLRGEEHLDMKNRPVYRAAADPVFTPSSGDKY